MTDRINVLREQFFADAHKAFRKESLGLSILNEETVHLPFPIRKAMAFACAVENMPLFLLEGDLICGGKTVYKLPTYITEQEIANGNPHFECGEKAGYNNIFDNPYNLGQDERGFGLANSAIPAYYKLLPMGIPALISDIESRLAMTTDADAKTYYESALIVQKACLRGMGRYEAFCRTLAADCGDEARKAELVTMADNLARLEVGAPETYWQAIQLMYFIQFLVWTEGGYLVPLGRTDQILYPFMQKDIEAGTLTKEFAFELLEAFFMKLNYEIDRTHGEEIRINSDSGQSVTIGGCDPITGEPVYNEMTMMILDAKCDMKVTDPKVHLRVRPDMPKEIWEKAAYLNSLGMGFPTYENDETIIPALIAQGYKPEHARDYAASGCWEITVQGRSLQRGIGGVDPLRMIEWAMNNGSFALGTPSAETAEGMIGDRFGIKTGEPEWFDAYAKFFNAVKVQMKHHIDMTTSYCNRAPLSPSPFYSSVMDGPVDAGRDFDAFGAVYNETDFQMSCLSNAADALYAIKRIVYEEKRYTLREFNEILLADWAGHEDLRQEILNDFPKFGNNEIEVDAIANELVRYYVQEVTKHHNAAGVRYRARISGATSYVYNSRILGASADGRKAHEFYSNNLSPMLGADRNGPTAIVLSCGNVDFSHCAGGEILDMKFHPSALNTAEGREKFIALLQTYFKLGGLQTQINVLDNKTLIDAQKHPENYRDLIVRIWGFSTYFVQIAKHWQDHIIQRSSLTF